MSTKVLYTSNYARQGKNPAAISISVGGAPRWFKGMPYYEPLMPTCDIVREYKEGMMSAQEYTKHYLKVLEERGKTPQQIVDELPERAILLCYEKATDFCHRHVAAKWLMEGADVKITEIITTFKPGHQQ